MKIDKVTITMLVVIYTLVVYLVGSWAGHQEEREWSKQFDCKSNYSSTPLNQVPISCYKYFN